MRSGRLRDSLVLAALALYALPFFWQALTSVRPDAELLPLSHLLPSRLTAVHYEVVLRQSLMPRALLNSLGIALSSTLLAVVLGALAGYALARLPVPGRGVILLGMIAATAFPQIATVSENGERQTVTFPVERVKKCICSFPVSPSLRRGFGP